jgi:hypothetical protein
VITEEQKYRAETSKIAGFALMAPFGRIVLDPYIFRDFELWVLSLYILLALILFLAGAVSVAKGHDILDI